MAAAPSTWTLKSGSTIEWPADTQAGNGNQGVAQIISGTDGAIGYVDYSDAVAAKLQFASVKNKSGEYIAPSPESATAAGDGVDGQPDLTFKAVQLVGARAYPITAQTFDIIYQDQADASKGNLLKAYMNYLVGDGQKLLPDLDYAPLPTSIQQQAVAQLDQIKIG